ncbi:MAG: phosphoesterase [Deltaproteobacteria bacterium]|nr:phosphoesterase [Deltaproteobacteria bacterium]
MQIVRRALERDLDLIAICDHNSAENVQAVRRAAAGTCLGVIGGMEITTREEIHMLGLFGRDRDLLSVQQLVHEKLPGENEPEFFGEQLVMNERDEVVGCQTALLIGATELGLEEAVACIHAQGGLAIAAHIDRPSFSLRSQIGFVPDDLDLDALEVWEPDAEDLPEDMAVLRSSDAHRLDEIGSRRTLLEMESATFEELGMALKGMHGRRVVSR